MNVYGRQHSTLLLLGVLFQAFGFAQEILPTARLNGRVVDDSTGVPLHLANVFVAGSLLGTSTDSLGAFELKGVPMGNAEIVASLVGYKPQVVQIRLLSAYYPSVDFRLKPSLIQLQPVIIDASAWKDNFEQFKKLLFGYSANAKRCEIVNPSVLEFAQGEEPGTTRVDFDGPLEVDNRALGYKLFYYLTEFVMHKDFVRFEGTTKYLQLKPQDDDQNEDWQRRRQTAYQGSMQHFFSALMNGQMEEEGFSAYMVNSVSLTNTLKKVLEPDQILFRTEIPYEKRFSFEGLIEIIYRKERAESGFRSFMHLQGASSKFDALLQVQTSWIKMNKSSGIVRIDGVLADPYAVVTYGYWSFERVAEMLPLDYKPPKY